MNRKLVFRYVGRAVRILIFILNAIAWVIGILCVLGSLVVGMYSNTIKINGILDYYDFTLTTPCTIYLYYGILILVTSSPGCFTGSGGRWWSSALYAICLVCLGIFDYYIGIKIFYKRTSFSDFFDNIELSMHKYLMLNETFGIFPHPVAEYWQHIQLQNECCGMYDWTDWRVTPLGKLGYVPDSCCNDDYRYEDCGRLVGLHPDIENHQATEMINTRGCLLVYPRRFIWSFKESTVIGVCFGIILLISFFLTVFLFAFVIIGFYRPGQALILPKPAKKRSSRKTRRVSHGTGEPRRFSNDINEPRPENDPN